MVARRRRCREAIAHPVDIAGAQPYQQHLLVSVGLSRAYGACRAAARCPMGAGVMTSPSIAPLIERYFAERLMHQRGASPHTVASYRDTFRLLLRFAQRRLGKPPSHPELSDLDAPSSIPLYRTSAV